MVCLEWDGLGAIDIVNNFKTDEGVKLFGTGVTVFYFLDRM